MTENKNLPKPTAEDIAFAEAQEKFHNELSALEPGLYHPGSPEYNKRQEQLLEMSAQRHQQ